MRGKKGKAQGKVWARKISLRVTCMQMLLKATSMDEITYSE